MSLTDVFAISSAVVVSLGGGAALVFAMSNWLGSIWATRLMQKAQALHDAKLEELRAKLERDNGRDIEKLKRQLDIALASHLREVQEKVAIYRAAIDIVADVLGDFDRATLEGSSRPDAKDRLDRFNRGRMRAYGYMAMLAPQDVMDAFDNMIDRCLLIAHGNATYEWSEVRALAINPLNEIRKDVGLDKSAIVYKGIL